VEVGYPNSEAGTNGMFPFKMGVEGEGEVMSLTFCIVCVCVLLFVVFSGMIPLNPFPGGFQILRDSSSVSSTSHSLRYVRNGFLEVGTRFLFFTLSLILSRICLCRG